MKQLHIKSKLLALLATVGVSLLGTISVSAWGPERTTFTMEHPATYPTFNSITNNPSIGDERDFVRIGEINADVTSMTSHIEIQPGKQYLVYIYFHNNASATYNDAAHNYSGVSMVTRMSSSFPQILRAGEEGKVTGTITAKNTNPESVWDEAYLTTNSDRIFLHYVPGSSRIYNDWATDNTVVPMDLFTAEGTAIGLNSLNGVIPGCDEYHGTVTYVLQAEELGGTIIKNVSKDGQEFGESVNLAPGEEATYRLTIANTGNMPLTDVYVKDELPAGLSLVPGSAQLTTNLSDTPQSLPDTIFDAGYNLGTLGIGNTIYITYKVVAGNDFDCNGTELTNHATLTYDSEQTGGETKEASSTITVKRTDCTPPAEDLDNCDTNPGLPECQIPDELPSTGPVEIAIAVAIIIAILGVGFYLYRTHRTLKTVQRGVMNHDSVTTKPDTQAPHHDQETANNTNEPIQHAHEQQKSKDDTQHPNA